MPAWLNSKSLILIVFRIEKQRGKHGRRKEEKVLLLQAEREARQRSQEKSN
jgi:hypothetical protein